MDKPDGDGGKECWTDVYDRIKAKIRKHEFEVTIEGEGNFLIFQDGEREDVPFSLNYLVRGGLIWQIQEGAITYATEPTPEMLEGLLPDHVVGRVMLGDHAGRNGYGDPYPCRRREFREARCHQLEKGRLEYTIRGTVDEEEYELPRFLKENVPRTDKVFYPLLNHFHVTYNDTDISLVDLILAPHDYKDWVKHCLGTGDGLGRYRWW